MIKNKRYQYLLDSPSENIQIEFGEDFDEVAEPGTLEITGTGEIRVRNTGGSSASEGGMGSDSDDDKTKGELTKSGGDKSGNRASEDADSDITFDPIKKNVRKAEKEQDKD